MGALDSLTLLSGNSGTKDAGTVRVVLATDQPALTNKLLVTPDLPSGASTAAKQPALGTAGTASTDVISIQGIASMTPVQVSQSTGTNLHMVVDSGTVTTVSTVTSLTQMNGAAIAMGTGARSAGTQRVTIATDDVVPVTDNGGSLTVDQPTGTNLHTVVDSGTITTVSTVTAVTAITNALPAGTNAIGKLAANSGVDIGDVDVTSLPALAAGTNAIGKLLPPDIDVTTHTNYAKKYYTNAGAVTDGIVWSPAAGKRWHVVSMYIQTSAAATVTLEDDKAGGDEAVWKAELAANSGMTINFGEKYPLASGEDAADLLVTTSAGNIYITTTGYEI